MLDGLTVMIIGSGAREHVISCAYEKSPRVKKIIVAPGNDFIAWNRQKEIVLEKDCSLKSAESFLRIAEKHKPNLIDVAQDDAVAAGTVDLLQKHGFRVFGPTKQAGRIEWDKKWSREFMQKNQIPAPAFRYFDSEAPAKEYVKSIYSKEPNKILFVKAAGLCAGKGALKSSNLDEALANIESMKQFGESGRVFLVEDGLIGEEFSYYAISDGDSYKLFRSAQDNKTVFNFDKGDQTGGMGAVSPALVTDWISGEIEEHQIRKAINGMKLNNSPYVGVLYLGGIVAGNKPLNIEYNARWGDPECQAVLPSVETDYVELVEACLEKMLSEINLKQDNKTRICVIGASRGYPGDYSAAKGKRIYGLEDAAATEGVKIFGAGITIKDGNFYANGGRLFSVVGEGKNVLEARQRAYSAISKISIEGNNLHYRTDIGWRDVERFLKRS